MNQNRAGELFDLLVEYPDLVEMRDTRGNFLIHYAVNRGFLRIIDLLISQGAGNLHLSLFNEYVLFLKGIEAYAQRSLD